MKALLKSIALIAIILSFNCKQTTEEPMIEEVVDIMPESSSEMSKAVLDHHIEAFLANDLDGVISDYTEDAVFITPDTMVIGLEGIKGLFTELMAAFPTEGTSIEPDKVVIENELAYVLWHGKSPVLEVPFATDTFIIKNNKIQRQTFAGILNLVK